MENDIKEKKVYTVRRLSGGDTFKISKIFRELGLKTQLKLFFKGVSMEGMTPEAVEEMQKEMGMDLLIAIFEKLSDAETEVADFLGGLVNMSGKEFLDLPLEECLEILTMLKDQKGLVSFLKLAAR
jgi:hypothetical protein